MVIEINIKQGIKAKIERTVKDATAMGSNVFDVRVEDIGLVSV